MKRNVGVKDQFIRFGIAFIAVLLYFADCISTPTNLDCSTGSLNLKQHLKKYSSCMVKISLPMNCVF